MNKYKFGVFQFVLTDKRYSFFDRLFYFSYIIGAILAIYFLVNSFWVDLEFNFMAFGFLFILLFFAPKIRTKFTDQYVLTTKGEEEMKLQSEIAMKGIGLAEKSGPVFVEANFSGAAIGLGIIGLIFGTILLFHYLGFAERKFGLGFLLPILIIELIGGIYFLIKVMNQAYKPVNDPAMAILKDKRIPLRDKILAFLIMVVILGLIFYRVVIIGK